jgi:molecular chaperone GrpE
MDRSEILQRFEQCLDAAMADEAPPQGIPAEILAGDSEPGNTPTDWHTVWAAMTALTQEIKLQGRAFKQLSESLAAEAERRGRKESMSALLEMRERLSRGLEGMGGPDGARVRDQLQPTLIDRLFAQRWQELEHARGVVHALEDGYRLTLGYLDDLLSQYGLRPVECLGQPFDPRRMNAVDVEETDRAAEGTVVFVYRAGYEWNEELYRPAQVRVARRSPVETSASRPAASTAARPSQSVLTFPAQSAETRPADNGKST